MSLIKKTDYGLIAINNKAIARMVVDELDSMSDKLLMCNKKGKIVKDSSNPFVDTPMDSVDIFENKKGTRIRIFIITNIGDSASDIADIIISRVEDIYDMLKIKRPDRIDVCIKGMMADQLIKKNIEVSRKNG